jgi:parallel beta-helix repeat protein
MYALSKIVRAAVVPISLWLILGCASAQSVQCTGISIGPFDATSINSTINSQPNGTTFCFEAGTYNVNSTIQLKSGNKLICKVRRGCIVDGANAVGTGFQTAWAASADQLISGFVVQRFTQTCMRIRARGRAEDNDIHDCDTGMVVDGAIVRNYIHHNRRYGISGGPATGILIEGNEIAFNNTAHYDPNNNAGASKFIGSKTGTTITWRSNKVHDNYGKGIWQDGNVINTLVEGNEVYNNTGIGIFHELSWTAVIRNNIVYNNDLSNKNVVRSCWYGAQIALNNSQNVDIYGNTVTAEYVNGICLANTTRSDTAPYPTALANVRVYNNTIKMRGSVRSGFVGDRTPSGVGYSGNTYYVNNLTGVFWQSMGDKTKIQWQSSGQDTAGIFQQW